MIKKILLLLLVAIVAVLAYAATKPDSFHVERSITVKAPPQKIFPLVNDLPTWKAWSPFETQDPGMKRSFSGPSAGVGAIYDWDGDSNVGKGRMQIAESAPPSKIVLDLHFMEPMEGRNIATFNFAPQGEETKVTWAMDGPNPYLCKLISVFIDMDRMIGNDFETGLQSLKAMAEKLP